MAAEVFTGEFSFGSQSDLEQGPLVPWPGPVVANFGMSHKFGPHVVKPLSNGYQGEMGVGYSEKVAADIDSETQAILAEAAAEARLAREVLLANRAPSTSWAMRSWGRGAWSATASTPGAERDPDRPRGQHAGRRRQRQGIELIRTREGRR